MNDTAFLALILALHAVVLALGLYGIRAAIQDSRR